jgi:hypothetical protein
MVSADARVTDVTISRVPNYRIRATLTIHREDPTGQDASGNWKGALAITGTVVQALLVALQGGASGEVIEAVRGCRITGEWITGATGGNSICSAEGGTAGLYTETKPSTSGDADTVIGQAVGAITLDIACQSNPRFARRIGADDGE